MVNEEHEGNGSGVSLGPLGTGDAGAKRERDEHKSLLRVGRATPKRVPLLQRKLRIAAVATQCAGETVLTSRPEAPVLSTPKGWAVCETQVSIRGIASNDEVKLK